MTSTVNNLARAAFMAQDVIDRIHDLTSLETAGQAVVHFSQVLAQTSPEDQRLTKEAFPDIPTLFDLQHAHVVAAGRLNLASFAASWEHVS